MRSTERRVPLTALIVLRFLRGLLPLWVVVTLEFFGLRVSGDPVVMMLGLEASPEAYEAMREKLGLNDSLPVQYYRYVSLIAQGDFGESIRGQRPVTEAAFERLPATVELAVAALTLATLLGIPIGILAAYYRNGLLDRGLMSIVFFGQSAPNFFVGILLIMMFTALFVAVVISTGAERSLP